MVRRRNDSLSLDYSFRRAFRFTFKRLVPYDRMNIKLVHVYLMNTHCSYQFNVCVSTDQPLSRLKEAMKRGMYHLTDTKDFRRLCNYSRHAKHKYSCKWCNRETLTEKRKLCSVQEICDGHRRPQKQALEEALAKNPTEDVLYFMNGKYVDDDSKTFRDMRDQYVEGDYIFMFHRDTYRPCNTSICKCDAIIEA